MYKSKLLSTWRGLFIFALFALFPPLAFAVPKIASFGVNQVAAMDPGTELQFTLEGTPRANVSLRITGVPRTIVLKETDSGVYEGTYTVRKQDRIPAKAAVIATLREGKRRTTARLDESLVVANAAVAHMVPVQQSPVTQNPNAPVAIDRFTSDQIERYEPGTELKFTMTGTPHARALFTIENVVTDRAMDEVRAGVYEGRYTIRRQDNFTPAVRITGMLQANGQTARTQLDHRLVNDTEPPSIINLAPRDNETVTNAKALTINGTFEDGRGTGVDPKSVKIMVDGKDVTALSTISSQNFSYRPANATLGHHTAEVRMRDQTGNASRTNWSFRMNTAEPAPVTAFPLDFLFPRDNAEVGVGAIQVRGHTLPNALVDVEVTASMFGLTQRLFANNMRADAQGNFNFAFQPQLAVPGAHYEVNVRANKDKETREATLTLIQKR